MMTTDDIIETIRSGALDNTDLAEIAGVALAAGLDNDDGCADDFIDEVDSAVSGRLSSSIVRRFRDEETIHALISLVVERAGPGRTTDQVHEMALHHWSRDGLEQLELTFAAILRDIRQREAMGLPFAS